MANSKHQKTCFIVRRYFYKQANMVRCIVRNESGRNYTVTVYEDGSTHCNCIAGSFKQRCYHVTHVLCKEAGRRNPQMIRAERARLVCESLGMITALNAPAPKAKHTAVLVKRINTTPPPVAAGSGGTDIATRGNLNGSRGFSLLKK